MTAYTAARKEITMHRAEFGFEFEASLNGELIGYYDSRIEAEEALDNAVYALLMRQSAQQGTVYNPDCAVLEAAYEQASSKPMDERWRNALERAHNWLLESDGVAVEYGTDGTIALVYIPSATGNGVYEVNGACACKAYDHGRPCWHRAAKRLLAIAWEIEVALAEAA